MAYGFTTEAPMSSGHIPASSFLPGRPDMPNASLPVIAAASTSTLGRRNTLAKALPAMPASEIGDLSFTNYRAVDAAEQMQALAVGQAERKAYERNNELRAKAKDRAMQRAAEKGTLRRQTVAKSKKYGSCKFITSVQKVGTNDSYESNC